jgi:hypothetical protein
MSELFGLWLCLPRSICTKVQCCAPGGAIMLGMRTCWCHLYQVEVLPGMSALHRTICSDGACCAHFRTICPEWGITQDHLF